MSTIDKILLYIENMDEYQRRIVLGFIKRLCHISD